MKKRSRLISVLLIIFIIISGLGYYATRSTIHLSKRLNNSAAMSEVEMSIVVGLIIPVLGKLNLRNFFA